MAWNKLKENKTWQKKDGLGKALQITKALNAMGYTNWNRLEPDNFAILKNERTIDSTKVNWNKDWDVHKAMNVMGFKTWRLFEPEDKQDDDDYVKDKLNRRLVKLISEINTSRVKEMTIVKEKEQKEKSKQETRGKKKKKKKAEDAGSDAPQLCMTKFGEDERKIHEAYQILLAEHIKRKIQRKKLARMEAIREKERVQAKHEQTPKSPSTLKQDISDFLQNDFSPRRSHHSSSDFGMDDGDDLTVFKLKDDEDGDDDVFGTTQKTNRLNWKENYDKNDVFDLRKKTPIKKKEETNTSENITNSYDFILTGNTHRDSFPCMAADYTFNHGGVNVIPDTIPSMTRKSSHRARKSSSGDNEEEKMAFVLDAWKSSGVKKGSLKKKKNVESKAINEISMNSLTLGTSDPSLKAISKWKTLRGNKNI